MPRKRKVKEVNYTENEVEDQHPGIEMNPNNETGADLSPEARVKSVSSQLQEDSGEKDEDELSHGKNRKPRKPVTPTTNGTRKGKASKINNLVDKLPTEVEARLENLFDKLPTEVVYTIFTFLHPLDLLRLARTNRMLRSHLMSKASSRIWKAARYTMKPPVPQCPSDQTEPRWARLLFTTECSNCSKNNILSIIWAHRLRLCHNCNRAGVVLILGEEVKWTFTEIEDVPTLLNLLPWSISASGKYYRISDIQKFGAEWTRIKNDGTKKEIEEFTKRRVKEVTEVADTIESLAKSWAKWERDRSHQKRKDEKDMKKSRRNEIFARLEALGYNPSDVRTFEGVMSSIGAFAYAVPLTESRWDMMRPQLEVLVNQAKSKRLNREQKQAVRSRRDLAETLVGEYYAKSNIRPAFRSPSFVRDIVSSKMFQEVIQRPTEVSVSREDFEEALDTVPKRASNTARAIQRHLLKLMVAGGAPDIKTSPTESSFDALLSATATFFCSSRSNTLPYCGVGELDGHCCFPSKWQSKFYCLSYNSRASSTVAALLTVAGLDSNTTVEQMDGMDLSFSCSGCSSGSSPLVMSWREAASHAKTVDHGENIGWELFSFEEFIEEQKRANIGGVWIRFRDQACYLPPVYGRKELEDHLMSPSEKLVNDQTPQKRSKPSRRHRRSQLSSS